MAAHLMILNPKRGRAAKRKRRSGGRRRPMTAKQLPYFGPRRTKSAGRRKRRAKVLIQTTNPKRVARRRFAKNPKRKHHHRRRSFNRNPLPFNIETFAKGALMPAAIGAAGAIAVDVLIGMNILPASLTTGPMLTVVRLASALLIGVAVGEVAGSQFGENAAAGAMTVTLYGIGKTFLQQNAPTVPLARYTAMGRYAGALGYIRPGMQGVRVRKMRRRLGLGPRQFVRQRFGVLNLGGGPMRANRASLGYIGPARTLGRYATPTR